MILEQKEDGRILLKIEGKHMWLNTPTRPYFFNGENVYDILQDYCDWLARNVERMNWLENAEEGIAINLTD